MRRVLLVLTARPRRDARCSPAPAAAHVTVTAPGATPGGSDQQITFRVPVEKDVADRPGSPSQLPTDTPIASVDVAADAGLDAHADDDQAREADQDRRRRRSPRPSRRSPGRRTGRGLKPGEFGQFTILAGQLPDASSLTFKAMQTYSDGSVVRWIETAGAGSDGRARAPGAGADLTRRPSRRRRESRRATPDPVVLSIIALVRGRRRARPRRRRPGRGGGRREVARRVVLVVALGVAGLVRGAVAQPAAVVRRRLAARSSASTRQVRQPSADRSRRDDHRLQHHRNRADRHHRRAKRCGGADDAAQVQRSGCPAHGSVALTGARRLVIIQALRPAARGAVRQHRDSTLADRRKHRWSPPGCPRPQVRRVQCPRRPRQECIRDSPPAVPLALLLAAVAACSSSGGHRTTAKPSDLSAAGAGVFQGFGLDPAAAAAAVHADRHRGQVVRVRHDDGEAPTLLFFGYTHCPDVCPTTMADIGVALRTVPAAVAKSDLRRVRDDRRQARHRAGHRASGCDTSPKAPRRTSSGCAARRRRSTRRRRPRTS